MWQFLSNKFSWGLHRTDYFCDGFDNSKEIDCGVGLCMALSAASYYRSTFPSNQDASFALVAVEIITRQEPQQLRSYQKSLLAKGGSDAWIEESCDYHKVVGFIDPRGQLTIWDFFSCVHFRLASNKENCVLAIRLTPFDEHIFSHANGSSTSLPPTVQWEGFVLPLNDWVDIPEKCEGLSADIGMQDCNGCDALCERDQVQLLSSLFDFSNLNPIGSARLILLADSSRTSKMFSKLTLLLLLSGLSTKKTKCPQNLKI